MKIKYKKNNECIYIKPEKIDGNILYRWQSQDHIDYHRGPVWWIVFVFICITSSLLSIYYDNVILGILIFLFIPAYYVAHIRGVHIYDVVITDKSIYIGNKNILFNNIENYAVIEIFHNIYELIIIDKKKIEYTVYVHQKDMQIIKDILSIYIQEDTERKTSILKYLFNLLKI